MHRRVTLLSGGTERLSASERTWSLSKPRLGTRPPFLSPGMLKVRSPAASPDLFIDSCWAIVESGGFFFSGANPRGRDPVRVGRSPKCNYLRTEAGLFSEEINPCPIFKNTNPDPTLNIYRVNATLKNIFDILIVTLVVVLSHQI